MNSRPKPHGGGTAIVRPTSIAMSVALEIVAELRVKEQQVIKKHMWSERSERSERPSPPPSSSRSK